MILKVMCGAHLFSLPGASLFLRYVNKIANINYFLYLALDVIYFSKEWFEDRFNRPITL